MNRLVDSAMVCAMTLIPALMLWATEGFAVAVHYFGLVLPASILFFVFVLTKRNPT